MVLISALAALLVVTASQGDPQAAVPTFARYGVRTADAGTRAPLRLQDARSRRFRAALADAYDGDVDFAGHYVLAEIGCGAACLQIAALDVRSGAVRWLPFSVSGWSKAFPDPAEHRAGSRLLLVHGRINETGEAGVHAFVFDGRSFTLR